MAKVVEKDWYKSKTFWFGALIVINAIAAMFGYTEFKPSVDTQKIVELATGLIAIYLRFKTTQPIK